MFVSVNAFSCHAVNVYMFVSLDMTKRGLCWPAALSWAFRGIKSVGTNERMPLKKKKKKTSMERSMIAAEYAGHVNKSSSPVLLVVRLPINVSLSSTVSVSVCCSLSVVAFVLYVWQLRHAR